MNLGHYAKAIGLAVVVVLTLVAFKLGVLELSTAGWIVTMGLTGLLVVFGVKNQPKT